MHEIVTLQFGQEANYLGTHFWNAQESYFTYPPEEESPVNHDIHFRPGIAPDGSETFTPRALVYDLKGSFGSLKKVNALYEVEDEGPVGGRGVWSSPPIIRHAPPIPPSPYQVHLDAGLPPPPLTAASVRYWSDYARVYYHPKSLVQLSEFDVGDATHRAWEKWDVGADLFGTLDREEDLLDRDLRPFIEECDSLQGLQILTSVTDAWGGWTARWTERLRDEFGKLGIWVWGLEQGGNEPINREKRLTRLANSARSLYEISEQASVYVPVANTPLKAPSYLSLNANSKWQASAVHALAFESMTLPSRLRAGNGQRGSLNELEETINSTGKRRIAKLEFSVADPDILEDKVVAEAAQADKVGAVLTRQDESNSKDDRLNDFDADLSTTELPGVRQRGARRKKEHIFGRAESSRGAWSIAEGSEGRDMHDGFHNGPIVQRYSSSLLFPLLDSFPSIINVGDGHANKVAVYTGLTTCASIAEQVRATEQLVRRLVSMEEREAISNGLAMIAEEYEEGWDSGTDSDDD
ncbi:protein DML1 [Mytilinidion resinicola]|uniref:Protein DML1 n=1 Tax=Mytilinidion resinicola TaxID=574789 RepID=A0A6A6Z7M2_9PEZI|nr:protein DML1 [Mytilinidion resinicola]KAF2816683.1 protein DML1 [Mytilinidion resinicola]